MTESEGKVDLQAFCAAHRACEDGWRYDVTDSTVTLTCLCGASIVRAFDVPDILIHRIAFRGTEARDVDYLISAAALRRRRNERAERLRAAF